MNTDTIEINKRLVSGDETQFNLIKLRDRLWKETESNRTWSNPVWRVYLHINSCLYRDRVGALAKKGTMSDRSKRLDSSAELLRQAANEIEQLQTAVLDAETRLIDLTEGMLELVHKSNQPELQTDGVESEEARAGFYRFTFKENAGREQPAKPCPSCGYSQIACTCEFGN